jgi:hypothetical protein
LPDLVISGLFARHSTLIGALHDESNRVNDAPSSFQNSKSVNVPLAPERKEGLR